MDLDYVAIGSRIRKMRHIRGLTQETLAEHCGISLSFLGHIERGTRKMSLETLASLAEVLSTTTDMLLFEESSGVEGAQTQVRIGTPHFQNEEKRARFYAAITTLAQIIDDS